jgi:hypothetical protein
VIITPLLTGQLYYNNYVIKWYKNIV